jgi:hypothetical protein
VTKRLARIKSLPKSLTYFHQGKRHEGRFNPERIRWCTWTRLWDEAEQFGGPIPSLWSYRRLRSNNSKICAPSGAEGGLFQLVLASAATLSLQFRYASNRDLRWWPWIDLLGLQKRAKKQRRVATWGAK